MSARRIVILVVLAAVAALLVPRLVASRDRVREIRIVVRGMTYYVDGAPAANPGLSLLPGEQVRVVLKNEDRGMLHDFGISAWGVATGIVPAGKEAVVAFRAPSSAQEVEYACTPHSAMMRGRIAVR